ncbi:amidohydrolase family protein [Candidatus Poribacteria bacterium]|nr:amidohydrolase family protein [Candidatus Poribacteria bacterium]
MPSDLAHHIQSIPLVDTHEHMRRENDWVENGPDILQDLFGNYVPADLNTAGATQEAMRNLMDASKDIESRFEGIRNAWEATQFTGYGEAVSLIAKHIYGLDELTGKSLAEAQEKVKRIQTPGKRYEILHDIANLDHIQTDDFSWNCDPDSSGLDFFLYDLSWANFCNGQIDVNSIQGEVGIEVIDLSTLKSSMDALFDKHGPNAIAVKSQHAYNRTLNWIERSDEEASAALQKVLTKTNEEIDAETRLCLGDWCWAKGVELTIQHHLPFKIHTGYYAGNDRMPVNRIPSGNMCALFARYLDAKFVLMHISYPYNDELVALAKHYRNIWVDFCWAWSIDPYSSRDFLRRCIHAVPSNKLFAFGGDTGWPTSAMAYAIQARNEITRALEAEIDDGYMTEKQAMEFADRIMHKNQYECFDIEGTRKNIAKAA